MPPVDYPLPFPTDVSPALKLHVKRSERLVRYAYFDPAGVPTAGWGHTRGITADMARRKVQFSEAQCEAWFEEDLDEAEFAVRKLVKVPLNQDQYDALVDFVFNVGAANFGKSTLLKKLNAGDYAAVPSELRRWNKARDRRTGKLSVLPGLTIRREYEAKLFAGVPTIGGTLYGEAAPDATVIPAATPKTVGLWTFLLTLIEAILKGFRRV